MPRPHSTRYCCTIYIIFIQPCFFLFVKCSIPISNVRQAIQSHLVIKKDGCISTVYFQSASDTISLHIICRGGGGDCQNRILKLKCSHKYQSCPSNTGYQESDLRRLQKNLFPQVDSFFSYQRSSWGRGGGLATWALAERGEPVSAGPTPPAGLYPLPPGDPL